MATVSAAFKIAALNGGLDVLDTGTPGSSGDLSFLNSSNVVLATLPLSTTGFADAANVAGTVKAVANTISNSGTPTAGTIAKAQLRDKGDTSVIELSVGLSGSGAELIVSTTTIPGDATALSMSGLEVSLQIT